MSDGDLVVRTLRILDGPSTHTVKRVAANCARTSDDDEEACQDGKKPHGKDVVALVDAYRCVLIAESCSSCTGQSLSKMERDGNLIMFSSRLGVEGSVSVALTDLDFSLSSFN
jgi:hypothetical protein